MVEPSANPIYCCLYVENQSNLRAINGSDLALRLYEASPLSVITEATL